MPQADPKIIPAVPRIPVSDKDQDRLNELVRASVRSLSMNALMRAERYTLDNLPAATVARVGTMIRVKSSGTNEHLAVCLQTAAGAFVWVTLATAS